MASYPYVFAEATLLFLAVLLMIEYSIRRQKGGRQSAQNRRKEQQLAMYSAELKTLNMKFARESEIADQFPGITKKMTEKFPPEAYPAIAVRSAKDFFHAAKVGYFAPVEGSSEYSLVVGVGFPQDWASEVRIHSDEGILGMALQKKMVVSRTDLYSSSGRRSSRRSLEDTDIAADFVAPVFGVSGIVGALVVAGTPFPLEEERVNMVMLGDLLSVALQNATHLDPSQDGKWVDQLTGVYNRMYFLRKFESEIRRTENYRQALALFMFDIDEFKKINDTHGHYAGDVVIKRVAEIVRKNTRGYDVVGRYGGDEFMVLITSTSAEQAEFFAEHLRKKLSTTDISIPGTEVPVRVTISGGLAMFPTHGQATTELFRAADEALYESKRRGRNRILVAKSVGLDSGTAKGTDADQEPPASADISTDAGSDAVVFPLGELGEELNP
ncbi:MAG: GGDEF domain-containing protein [Deltaproteobacteria bacterium]|nr:GGDEF domain-containing protein [Deltaproteobacteria bacterium]